MTTHDSHAGRQGAGHGTLRAYVIGFILSIVLTMASYFIVANHVLGNEVIVATIVGLGSVQVFVQLLCFLHLGTESKPRWNLLVFLFMVLVLAIVVGGSLWIMNNLNYQVMPQMGQ